MEARAFVRDLVVYKQADKSIVIIVLDVDKTSQFLINPEYVGMYIDHEDYRVVTGDDGTAYFENLNDKILYLDDYRGRYEE